MAASMAREKCCIEQRWHLTMALKDVKIPGSSYPREPTPCMSVHSRGAVCISRSRTRSDLCARISLFYSFIIL